MYIAIFNNLIAFKLLSFNRHIHNLTINFARIHDICNKFTGNRVNEHASVSRLGIFPSFPIWKL